MTCSDPDLPTDSGNLCFAAAQRLASALGSSRGFRLHLDKRVPYGAGLGSGSSDAAAVLRMLARGWGIGDVGAPGSVIPQVAAGLGSDVPFFLEHAVAAFGKGRGDELTALDWVCPYPLVVAVPPVFVATGQAYQIVSPSDAGRVDLREVVCSDDLDRWAAELVNDFEGPVARAHPQVAQALAFLRSNGARYAALSGSGSAVFGVFETAHSASAIAAEMAARGYRTWSGFARSGD